MVVLLVAVAVVVTASAVTVVTFVPEKTSKSQALTVTHR